jgi:hypothetical protein
VSIDIEVSSSDWPCGKTVSSHFIGCYAGMTFSGKPEWEIPFLFQKIVMREGVSGQSYKARHLLYPLSAPYFGGGEG